MLKFVACHLFWSRPSTIHQKIPVTSDNGDFAMRWLEDLRAPSATFPDAQDNPEHHQPDEYCH